MEVKKGQMDGRSHTRKEKMDGWVDGWGDAGMGGPSSACNLVSYSSGGSSPGGHLQSVTNRLLIGECGVESVMTREVLDLHVQTPAKGQMD